VVVIAKRDIPCCRLVRRERIGFLVADEIAAEAAFNLLREDGLIDRGDNQVAILRRDHSGFRLARLPEQG